MTWRTFGRDQRKVVDGDKHDHMHLHKSSGRKHSHPHESGHHPE